MNHKSRIWPLLAMVVMLAAGVGTSVGDDDGKVTQVTLYRNQALVTRTITVDGEPGIRELVVGNLPERIVADSLFAEGADDVEVRAVQFRARAVGESPREEVRQIETQMESLQDELALNQRYQETAERQAAYLDQLEGFVAPTAKLELSQGVLDPDSLKAITQFSFERRDAIADRQVQLTCHKERGLKEQLNLLERQLRETTSGATQTIREAVLYVNKSAAGAQSLKLNYLVDQCGWSPNYTIRAAGDRESAEIDYNALIYQMSGENWAGIHITLSTASPALSAAGPGLAPLRITLRDNGQQAAQGIAIGGKQQLAEIVSKQKMAVQGNRAATNYQEMNDSNWTLNDAANELACMVLFGDEGTVSDVQKQMESMADEPSLSYQLDTTVTLPSRNERQMIRIVSSELPGQFYHVATPVLTNYVYREAELVNNSSEDLLSGPIMVYLDGKFVGRGEIPTVARGQEFVVGFGADPQLRTRRELVDKSEGINGGNRELKFEYRMVIENFKDQRNTIRVVDRMPTPTSGSKIRITRNEFSVDLSDDDPYYERVEKPEGILRWDIDVPAGASGNDAHMIDYAYTVEYDRNYVVSLPESMNQLRQDFERLQRGRTVR